MKDIAREAGVSIATVSHVVNKTRNVSTELQTKVYEAMDALGYRRDGIARGLKTRCTGTVGLLISDILNPFYPMLVRGVEDCVHEQKLSLILCNTDEDLEKQSMYINVLLEKRVDGIICTPAIGTKAEHLFEITNMNIPIVLIDRIVAGIDLPAVVTDNYKASYDGTAYLIKQGHRRIVLIHGPHWTTTGEERYDGYIAAHKDYCLKVNPRLILQGNFRAEIAYEMVKTLFQMEGAKPTAIFSMNNMMTLGTMKALQELRIRIPDDVSILSFDDTEWFRFTSPSISAISQPTYEMGNKAATKLRCLLDKQKVEKFSVLPSTFVLRDSIQSIG